MSEASATMGDTGATSGAGEAASGGATTRPKGKGKTLVMGALAALAVAGGGAYYASHHGLETTDDAQVDSDVVPVPARTTAVATKVLFVENQVVKAGDVLAELDADPARARLAQAEAAVEAAVASADAADAEARLAAINAKGNKSFAEASLRSASAGASQSSKQINEGEAEIIAARSTLSQAKIDRDRAESLAKSGAIARQQVDSTQTAFDTATARLAQSEARLAALRASVLAAQSHVQEASAKLEQSSDVSTIIIQAQARARVAHAQVETSKAQRDLAALELSYTKITAPQDGIVSRKNIAVGQMIAAGQSIVMLVPTSQTWITGNFKETQLTTMRVGQPAHFTVDAYPGTTFQGEVESLSGATGARFALLPPDNATGNFTKIVQRVPVRIRLRDGKAEGTVRPGMSVELTVDTRK